MSKNNGRFARGIARIKKSIPALLSLCFILALWQGASLYIHSSLVLPEPKAVFSTFIFNITSKVFLRNLLATALRCFEAFLLSFITGGILGFMCARFCAFNLFLRLPLWIIKATPVVALVLMALFWFKAADIPIFVAVLLALPVMTTAFFKGFSNASSPLSEAATFYALTKTQIHLHIRLPAALPFIAQGASSSYALIWKAVCAGEVLSQPKTGLGSVLFIKQVHLETESVFSCTVALILCGFLSEAFFSFCAKRTAHLIRKKQKEAVKKEVSKISFTHSPLQKEEINKAYNKDTIFFKPLTVRYGENLILDNFSYPFSRSSVTALLAPSGAGKTTFLTALAKELVKTGQRLSFVFQDARLIPSLSIFENIRLPLENILGKKKASERAAFFLKKTGLSSVAEKLPSEVSGGEKQRAALARAFAYPSDLLLMDEAFQSQDMLLEKNLLTLTCTLLKEEGRTVIFATHSIREASVLPDVALVLGGRPLCIKERVEISANRKKAPYNYLAPDNLTLQKERALINALSYEH